MAQTRPTIFYLGTHEPSWLEHAGVRLFVSNRRLFKRRSFPRAAAPWALDSGGFSELSLFDRWQTTHEQYVTLVRRYQSEIGRMEWCSAQDWMCEPQMLAKTGLTVAEHQRRTVRSFLRLRHDGLPVIPPIQGWTHGDYLDCIELYDKMGVDLRREPLVGLGSICRRQSGTRAALIIADIARLGIRLHGYGLKIDGLTGSIDLGDSSLRPGEFQQLVTADSLAWSFDARHAPPLPGHTHKSCANCIDYAMKWRRELFAKGRGMIV